MEENAQLDGQEVFETPETELSEEVSTESDGFDADGDDSSDLSVEERLEKLERERAIFKRRATKAEKALESKANTVEAKATTKKVTNNQTGTLSMGDVLLVQTLQSKGITDPEHLENAVAYVQKVAGLNGVNPKDAANSDEFKFWNQAQVKAQKEQEAAIGAARGGNSARRSKTFKGGYLSKGDHKNLWNKRVSGSN